jgi:DNA primase large subunit
MEIDNLQVMAKYPFLEESRKYVEGLSLTLEKIGEHPVYSAAINLGKQRILELLENRFKPEGDDKTDLELLMLSYPIARVLVHLLGNRILSARYANGEANRAYSLLKAEDKKTVDYIKRDLKLDLGSETSLATYLSLASRLVREDPRWKLVNRTVHKGMVQLNEGDDMILLREAIRQKALEPVGIKNAPESLKKTLNELKVIFSAHVDEAKIDFLEEKALPPCIRYITGLLQKDEANHNARFILATFLAGLGLNEDRILKIFSKSPKYDEEKTRYQLEFLTGKKSSTKYTCPGCQTIKSYGLCKGECRVKHPQQYYRNNAGRPTTSSQSSKGS